MDEALTGRRRAVLNLTTAVGPRLSRESQVQPIVEKPPPLTDCPTSPRPRFAGTPAEAVPTGH